MPKYSIDTSAILDAWIRNYPIDIFPTFWSRFKVLCETGIATAIELVDHELKKKDDGCSNWFKEQGIGSFFTEITDEVQFKAIEILEDPNYQLLIEDRKGLFGADPFIIAHAQVYSLTLVTGERPTGSLNRPKIPDVCNELDIRWINIQQLIREEKWSF